jgi:nucleoid DNA-binding protein
VTKKEIVKQISDRANLTQLKTKEIVQWTFDAIVETLIEEGRIELRNFGVFEVKRRKARKARNPRTGAKVDVEPKNVVTFQPGKEMEEKVRVMARVPDRPRGRPRVGRPSADSDGAEHTDMTADVAANTAAPASV